nr:NADH dehydrogenase subunit 6 [Physella acuta]
MHLFLCSLLLNVLLLESSPLLILVAILLVVGMVGLVSVPFISFLYLLFFLIYIGGVLAMVAMVCMLSSNFTISWTRKGSLLLCGVFLFVLDISPGYGSPSFSSPLSMCSTYFVMLLLYILVVMMVSKSLLKKNSSITCYI